MQSGVPKKFAVATSLQDGQSRNSNGDKLINQKIRTVLEQNKVKCGPDQLTVSQGKSNQINKWPYDKQHYKVRNHNINFIY